MNKISCILLLVLTPTLARGQLPAPLADGLKHPESVAVGGDGRVYVTVAGEYHKDGDGAVLVLDKGKAVPFATGLDDPKGIAAYQKWLFVADEQRVWRIDLKGKAEVYVAATAFPEPHMRLHDIAVDPESGTLYVSGMGSRRSLGGPIYRVTPKGKVDLLTDKTQRTSGLETLHGLVMDGASHLLVTDSETGELLRLKVADGSTTQLATVLDAACGLAWDRHGRLFLAGGHSGRVYAVPRPGVERVVLPAQFRFASGICFDPTARRLLVVDRTAGTLTALPLAIPGAEVDETPLPLLTTVAFPDLQWTGWKAEDDKGKIVPLRPIVLTHAGDTSNRVFVATQHGVIHVFPNDPKAKQTKLFLDIQDRVSYSDNQNEEGFLGLAFHPRHKENGEFFVFYTPKKEKMTNVVSRFRVSKDDPDRADPASEEVLLRFKKPFWNHDGGTVCFGPDGYLYVTHGDGGAANDPFNNGQNLKSLLGKVLRLDVDRKDGEPGGVSPRRNYAIPKDNPFVGRDDALPEIWAYGLRNIWRMAFDRKTGRLWAGDVGQNLYEEINLIDKGGNYGWKLREGLHPFGAKGVGRRADLIDPIWEYHHDVGKSITGGVVYRGRGLPELDGMYLYADYVTGRIWALRYDESARRVVANRLLRQSGPPIMSFGEDEQGEVYCMTYSPTGRGLFRFARPR